MRRKLNTTVKSGSKKRKLAVPSSTTKLYADDFRSVADMMRQQEKTESEVLREIVSDWFRKKRVEAYGKDQTDESVRRVYERIIDERISPLSEVVHQVKAAIDNLPNSQAVASVATSVPEGQSQSPEIMATLRDLRELLERTGYELTESANTQVSLLDEVQRSQKAVQGISCETYAATWTITDFIVRYLVEIALRKDNSNPTEVEAEVLRDRNGLRLEGLNKISMVEALFQLPNGFNLASRFLPQNFSPLNASDQVNQMI
jgi:hypothetical protein